MAYLVFDLGTSGGKSAVVGEDGRVLAVRKESWTARQSPGLESIGREFDPAEVRARLLGCAEAALKESAVSRSNIRAIASTSLRFGYVFLDKDDQVLYFGSNMDGRGFFEQGNFVEAAGDQTHEVTGLYPPMLFCIPKLLWFKENAPTLHERVAKIMNLNDWWAYSLSGAFLTDPASASTTGIFDIKKSMWSGELMDTFGLDASMLPDVRDSGQVAGELKPEFRSSLELGRTQVVLAGPDTQLGLLGAGCIRPGEVGIVAGATSPVQEVVETLPTTLGRKLLIGSHLLPGRFVVESNAGPCGLLYDWAVRLYAGTGADAYRKAEQLFAKLDAGPTGIFSMLGAQVMVLEKTHVLKPAVSVFPSPLMGGIDGADPGLFLKAVIEELCYAASCNVDEVEEFTGISAPAIKLVGGLVRNKEFIRILSDASGRDVLPCLHPDGTLVGGALCGMVGAGQHANLTDACQKTELVGASVHPDDKSQSYLEAKKKWRDLYFKMLALAEDGDL